MPATGPAAVPNPAVPDPDDSGSDDSGGGNDIDECFDGREGFCNNPQYVEGGALDPCYPCDFIYFSSIQQGFYFFEQVKLGDQQIDANDWVGAFNGDVCVGAREWGSGGCDGDEICDLPVLGYDQSDYTIGYMEGPNSGLDGIWETDDDYPGDIPS